MSVTEAREFFPTGQARQILNRLSDVGPRLPEPRPAADHAVRRRAAAAEAGDPHGREGVHLRAGRADHRPAPGRRRPAARPAGPAGRRRQHGDRHRAPPGRDGARRLARSTWARAPATTAAGSSSPAPRPTWWPTSDTADRPAPTPLPRHGRRLTPCADLAVVVPLKPGRTRANSGTTTARSTREGALRRGGRSIRVDRVAGKAPKETRHGVELTNLDQPLFDGAEATKRDLVDYLDAVHATDPARAARPAAVGDPGAARASRRSCRRTCRSTRPTGSRSTTVWAEASHREINYALCNDRRTLIWFANQRAVEYHPTLFTDGNWQHPSHLILDLDPPEGTDAFDLAVERRAPGAAGARRRRAWRAR